MNFRFSNLILFLALSPSLAQAVAPIDLMPRAEDQSTVYWSEGFPGVVPGAPWHRVTQSGSYSFVLDTESLKVPHFGPNSEWKSLPSADLILQLDVNGKSYRCSGAEAWSKFGGPRLVEAGRFFQRTDVTDLIFSADDGTRLNTEARFETASWPDRLGLRLVAQPGLQAIQPGEKSFGRIGGGFGLDGGNDLVIPHSADLDSPEFTLEFWTFIPGNYRASLRTWPWLVCKSRNEMADGNYGVMIVNGKAQGRINIGGGKTGAATVSSESSVKIDQWNHISLSYDGENLSLALNGKKADKTKVGRKRKAGKGSLVFGRRGDSQGDGYHFRGIIDEIMLHDRALSEGELRQRFRNPESESKARKQWSFQAKGEASMTLKRGDWKDPSLQISFNSNGKTLVQQASGNEVGVAIDPVKFAKFSDKSPVKVDAGDRKVTFEPVLGWHRINLDDVKPIMLGEDKNDAIEKVSFSLSNPSDNEQLAQLVFEKTARGIQQRIGSPITGITAVLRDANGQPTGIPVQLSKNWHNEQRAGAYSGQWFHGISQIRLPAGAKLELELVLAYGHWGGVAAASHAQLSLIGWGANQLWHESALGAWGESICYEPDQVQAKCSITDVRPLMVKAMNNRSDGRWGWTNNVGGGDFFRLFDPAGTRKAHTSMKSDYLRYGPCLTEVTYSGEIGNGLRHSETVSLARTDDLVRGIFKVRLDVDQITDFSRFVIFQIGADTYNMTREGKIALGNEKGVVKEWATPTKPKSTAMECGGGLPWISMHEASASSDSGHGGAWANRGMIIRSWKAKLGGKIASPWVIENPARQDTTTIDVVPPPSVTKLLPGDFVEATFEYVVMPQRADDYYGPNSALKAALASAGNTWKMIHRETVKNRRNIKVTEGTLQQRFPDVRIKAKDGSASLSISSGLGYVPITITGLDSSGPYTLMFDGKEVDQSVHGNDFWQCDFDPISRTWSRTYNLPIDDEKPHNIQFRKTK